MHSCIELASQLLVSWIFFKFSFRKKNMRRQFWMKFRCSMHGTVASHFIQNSLPVLRKSKLVLQPEGSCNADCVYKSVMAGFITISWTFSHIEDMSSTCRSVQAHGYNAFIASAKHCTGFLSQNILSCPAQHRPAVEWPFHPHCFPGSLTYCCRNISPSQIRKERAVNDHISMCNSNAFTYIEGLC